MQAAAEAAQEAAQAADLAQTEERRVSEVAAKSEQLAAQTKSSLQVSHATVFFSCACRHL